MPTEEDAVTVQGVPSSSLGIGLPMHAVPPGKLDVLSPHVVDEWKLWRQVFENYLILSGSEQRSEIGRAHV